MKRYRYSGRPAMASSRAGRVAAVSGALWAYGVRELFVKLKEGASAASL